MAADRIELFMWGYQPHFRIGLEVSVKGVWERLGYVVNPTVFLVGRLREGWSGHPLCIEPERGPLVPGQFQGIDARASELLEADPETQIIHSHPIARANRERALRARAMGRAICEVIAREFPPNLVFRSAMPAVVDAYDVHAVIGLPTELFEFVPRLYSEAGPDGRMYVTRSLADGVTDEILALTTRALFGPDLGSGLDNGIVAADVIREAGRALTHSAVVLAGNYFGSDLFDNLNELSTSAYERREGIGRLALASADSVSIDHAVHLRDSIGMRETRSIRKLLEVSDSRMAVLTDGSDSSGLGTIKDDYDSSTESVFEIVVSGRGKWELVHAGQPLMSVVNGAPRLPEQRIDKERFDDVVRRRLGSLGTADPDALWALVTAAAEAEHGTMLVISAEAANEAGRLGSQALVIDPVSVGAYVVERLTRIDGAVIVDPSGRCIAFGAILDGLAGQGGDRARGARYNSAVRYMETTSIPTVIVLVSEDGMINLLPSLRRQISRSELETTLVRLRAAAELEPLDAGEFMRALDDVLRLRFYLSPEQCEEVTALREAHWDRRKKEGAQIWFVDSPLLPNPEMSDEYFLD